MKKYLLIFSVLYFGIFSYSQVIEGDTTKGNESDKVKILKLLKPELIKWQFAGNIGMNSVGVEWNLYKKSIFGGFSLGYVPESRSISPIFVGTYHIRYKSKLKIKLDENFSISPLDFSYLISTSFGKRFSIYGDKEHYDENYYWWGVRTRFGIAHDMELYYKIDKPFLEGVGVYFNTSIWDLELYSSLGNGNFEYSKVHLDRLFTFGCGIKFYL